MITPQHKTQSLAQAGVVTWPSKLLRHIQNSEVASCKLFNKKSYYIQEEHTSPAWNSSAG
jgi:hypothetical protein